MWISKREYEEKGKSVVEVKCPWTFSPIWILQLLPKKTYFLDEMRALPLLSNCSRLTTINHVEIMSYVCFIHAVLLGIFLYNSTRCMYGLLSSRSHCFRYAWVRWTQCPVVPLCSRGTIQIAIPIANGPLVIWPLCNVRVFVQPLVSVLRQCDQETLGPIRIASSCTFWRLNRLLRGWYIDTMWIKLQYSRWSN